MIFGNRRITAEKGYKINLWCHKLTLSQCTIILKIPDLVKLKTAIIMFKAYRYMLPINVHKLFRIHESRYSSRQKCKFN